MMNFVGMCLNEGGRGEELSEKPICGLNTERTLLEVKLCLQLVENVCAEKKGTMSSKWRRRGPF